MSNNNPTGINGYGKKNYPPPDVLKESLHQYAKEKLSVDERLERLRIDHQLSIKRGRLFELNKQFDVPSVRKPPAQDVATQAVLQKVADDPNQNNGVGTIDVLLRNEGMLLPRDFIRNVLATHAPEGLAKRFPGSRQIRRTTLSAIGPNHQHHADGHEKLNAQALGMGGVGLSIYGIKDQWSSFFLHLVVVPNNRLETTIGHVYLDYVEKYQSIPITFIVDRGSETGVLYAHQTALRETYAPDIQIDRFPPVQHMRSVNNTPIESVWHWFLNTFGQNIKDIIRSGYNDGIFNPENALHVDLFNWLWPKILQAQLDRFLDYWNNHRIRYQKKKANMSGKTPRHAFTAPTLPAEDCRIPVHQVVIDALRGQISVSRADAMRWVEDAFAKKAQQAYESLGSPSLKEVMNGWEIFAQMARILIIEA